jgi:hypothetical protein
VIITPQKEKVKVLLQAGQALEFQEVEAPRFQDSWHMKVARLPALRTYCLQPNHCNVTTNHPGQSYWTLHFMIQRSNVIPTPAYALMLLLMMGIVKARNM